MNRYMPIIRKVTKVKEISPSQQIWTLYYKISAVLSPRVFTVLQVDHLDATDASRRIGTIVSIPIDLSSDPELAKLEEKGVKGHYVSVEQLVELESGTVRWTMATASTPGGVIPDAVTNASLPGEIAKDVPQFMKWLQQETR
ncbi:hypothetical protein BD626DRAFT_51243 [Schizophyllum amplum]|uniref:DUF3074 domain-containing protein n=1 Tax=Schizophyllum amplum TaxID=97359 RepID=A0A550CCS2_9AGAR|nr:hypothetical protein BD626DRAFT_51243 [Auriculariopsis ampla]